MTTFKKETFSDADLVGGETVGLVREHIGAPMWGHRNVDAVKRAEVVAAALADPLPVPTAARREGYFGPRHHEYWVSGRCDAEAVHAAYGKGLSGGTVVEMGGASGRVARHFPQLFGDDNRYVITDINETHVIWVNTHLAPSILAVQTKAYPPVPLPDASVDVVCAFSVFTHIYEYETAWLMEFKRVLKPGGLLYVTIHDDTTWNDIEKSILHPKMTQTEEYRAAKLKNPELHGRLIFSYGLRDEARITNVFHPQDYIRRLWGSIFTIEDIQPWKHDHQCAVIMRA